MNKISKLLLNSLLGKMGIKSEFNKIKIVNKSDLHETFQ